MTKKYNIALLPATASDSIINHAARFKAIAHHYLLGEQSLPHVTIYQFKAAQDEIDKIIENLESLNISKSIDLTFATFSCLSFDKKVHWASLMPDKVGELNAMHKEIAGMLGESVKPTYDPHMTLMSTLDENYECIIDDIKRHYTPIQDTFVLSIGESDEVGQYLKVLKRFE